MWFCHHCWSQGIQWGILLASSLCPNSNILSPWCLLRFLGSSGEFSLGVCFLLSACHVHQWGLSCWGLPYHNLIRYTLGRNMCLLVMVHGSCQYCTEWLLLPLLQVWGSSMLFVQLSPQPFHQYSVAYSFESLAESPDSSTFPIWWEGSSLPGCVPTDDTVHSKSVMGIKPCDSGVVIGY